MEAVVNAANSQLAGGGGVDGAIHRAAGHAQLQRACAQLGGCATGQVKVTPGFNLTAKYIFHAVGPVWRGGVQNEEQLLASCYRQGMLLATELTVKSIAFPAISCGVYGFPIDRATNIAVSEVVNALEGCIAPEKPVIEKVVFCCFDEKTLDIYKRELAKCC